jgi:hypothetical protein
VDRQVTPTVPVQATYQLTQVGRELMASLQPLVRWGLRWHGQQDQERSVGLPAHQARDSSAFPRRPECARVAALLARAPKSVS